MKATIDQLMSGRLIRPAVSADAGALAMLAREAYSGYIIRIGREPAPIGADYVAAIATGMVWVAVDEAAAVVGMIVLKDERDHILLENVAVLPHAQGRGIGSRLLRFAETIAAAYGLLEIRLYTNEAMTEYLGSTSVTGTSRRAAGWKMATIVSSLLKRSHHPRRTPSEAYGHGHLSTLPSRWLARANRMV